MELEKIKADRAKRFAAKAKAEQPDLKVTLDRERSRRDREDRGGRDERGFGRRNGIREAEIKTGTKIGMMNTMIGIREGMMRMISGEGTRRKNENQRKRRKKEEMTMITGRRKKRSQSGGMMTERRRVRRNTKSPTNLVGKTDTRMNMKRDRRGAKERTGRRKRGIQRGREWRRREKSRIVGTPGTRREMITRAEGKATLMATIGDTD